MDKKILIAYGTASGSTAEVAQAIADEMQKSGALVDVQPVESVSDINEYDGVVVGTAVRVFKILRKTRQFLRRHQKALSKVPVAYFLVCLTMGEETPETIRQAKEYAKPMIKTKEPINLGLFGGCIKHDTLTGLMAQPMKQVPEQDHRDWDKIRAWGRETLSKLVDIE